jgi:hypothetical protein
MSPFFEVFLKGGGGHIALFRLFGYQPMDLFFRGGIGLQFLKKAVDLAPLLLALVLVMAPHDIVT